jgi:ABC-type branched-subunit amino acid transport system substrate-binding protein
VAGGSGAGGTGGAATAGTIAPGAAPAVSKAAPAGGNGGATARGVTATSIKLGYVHPDVGAFGVVPQFQVGDGQKILKSILDGWQRSGRDVIYGRKLQFAFATSNISDQAQQRSVCTKMVDDEKVFAVASNFTLGVGTDCIAKEKKTPVLIYEYSASDKALFHDNYPYQFSGSPTAERIYRNWAHWMAARNLLQGKRLGMFFPNAAADLAAVMRSEIKKLGGNIVVEVGSDSQVAGPEDGVAVQQFRANRVDVAVLLVNAVAIADFMRQANAQLYHPTYMQSDVSSGTDDTAASVYPPESADGMYAMTTVYQGHTPTLAPETKACVDNYTKTWGAPPDAPWKSPWVKLNTACSAMELLHRGLELAGPDLTTESFIKGMEQIRNMNVAFGQGLTFSPADHSGLKVQRTIQWQRACGCFQAVSPFAPLFVG